MVSSDQATRYARGTSFGVSMILMLTMLVGCELSSAGTHSIQEQNHLSATRSAQMRNQLAFSFKLTPDHVLFGQDILFVATFTNTTDQPLVFREPRQHGVIEAIYPETTLLFAVEPISASIPFQYPLVGGPDILVWPPVEHSEFIRLSPHEAYETRLMLPHLVFQNGETGNVISLPPGQYLVHMTYTNDCIGYEVKRGEETRYIDVGAWVGKVKSNPVSLTVTAP